MGFEVNRFQGEVDEELVCPICSGVLEDPLQVRKHGNNFTVFRPCTCIYISKHGHAACYATYLSNHVCL
jgi:hypothetical protein